MADLLQDTLALEQALRSYLLASNYLAGLVRGSTLADPETDPTGKLALYCAHEAEIIPEHLTDYLVLIAGRPGGDLMEDAIFEQTFECQLHTGQIVDEAERPGAVALHDSRATIIEWIFGPENFRAMLAALTAAPEFGVGFTGWEPAANAPEADGRTVDGRLLTRLIYSFTTHRI